MQKATSPIICYYERVIHKKLVVILFIIVISYILFIFAPFIIYPRSVGGNFGIRPRTHQCLGFTINSNTAKKIFPKGNVSFNFIGKGFEYRISEWDREYCVGQDIWYGE